jgi:hypothetical protein
MFSLKAISSAFCVNTGPWTGTFNACFYLNYSRSTDSIFSHFKVFNFFLPHQVVTHCWSIFFLSTIRLSSVNNGMLNCSATFVHITRNSASNFLIISQFWETDVLHFMFAFVAKPTCQFTFKQLHEIQQTCSLYVTLYTKTTLSARWMEKVRKSLIIPTNFYQSRVQLSAATCLNYVSTVFIISFCIHKI